MGMASPHRLPSGLDSLSVAIWGVRERWSVCWGKIFDFSLTCGNFAQVITLCSRGPAFCDDAAIAGGFHVQQRCVVRHSQREP
jgi:hypothetical protein